MANFQTSLDVFEEKYQNEEMMLPQLVQHLENLETQKRDYIAPPQSLFSKNGTFHMVREGRPTLTLQPTDLALSQICSRLGIPSQYADKMRATLPDLFDTNVNRWLENEMDKPAKARNFMIRAYTENGRDGTLRAFLSERYFDISSLFLLREIIATVAELQNEAGFKIEAQINSLTDKNLYVRFYAPELEVKSRVLEYFKDTPTGNRHSGFFTGVIFRNSEVGCGMYEVAPRLITGACMNGNIYSSESFARKHVGGVQEVGDVTWSRETIDAEIRVITTKTKDCLKRWLSRDWLGKKVEEIEALADVKLSYPIDTVANIAAEIGLPDGRAKAVMQYLMGCGMGDTPFGVLQAFTGAAKQFNADWQWTIEEKITEKMLNGGWEKFDVKSRRADKIALN